MLRQYPKIGILKRNEYQKIGILKRNEYQDLGIRKVHLCLLDNKKAAQVSLPLGLTKSVMNVSPQEVLSQTGH